jgi:hypothetical protein
MANPVMVVRKTLAETPKIVRIIEFFSPRKNFVAPKRINRYVWKEILRGRSLGPSW